MSKDYAAFLVMSKSSVNKDNNETAFSSTSNTNTIDRNLANKKVQRAKNHAKKGQKDSVALRSLALVRGDRERHRSHQRKRSKRTAMDVSSSESRITAQNMSTSRSQAP